MTFQNLPTISVTVLHECDNEISPEKVNLILGGNHDQQLVNI